MEKIRKKTDIAKLVGNVCIFIIVLLGALTMLYPLVWMISTSFKENQHVYNTGLIPVAWRLRNYVDIWSRVPLLRSVGNSLIIAVPATVINILISTLAAFAFSKMKFFGKNALFMTLLASTMIPFAVIMIPQFVLFKEMGILKGPWAVLLPKFFGGAFTIFFLRQFLYGIPDSVIEAAKVDGASYHRIFFTIIIPLAMPAIVAQIILNFIGNWNDYLGPLIFIRDRNWYTIPLTIATFNAASTGANASIPLLMAAALISMLPIFVVFAMFQKRIVNSVMLSGGKL